MATIKKITARQILDSRGIPAIEGRLTLDNDADVWAQSSSGESLGKYEGVELRDKDPNKFAGLGVLKAVSFINDLLAPKLAGLSIDKWGEIDQWLIKADATENQTQLGVNTLMVVSQLVFKAAAKSVGMPIYKFTNSVFEKISGKKSGFDRLPAPIFNMINGGRHGNRNIDFQEFQIIPSTSHKFSRALEIGAETYLALRQVLEYRNAGTSVSEEGGFTPNLLTNAIALDLIQETLLQKKLKLGIDVSMGLDLSASEFFKQGQYRIKDKPAPLKPDDYSKYLGELIEKYKILIMEDPFEQEDFTGFRKLNEMHGRASYIVGDDFIAGEKTRLERAIKEGAIAGVVIKFNQVATISQILDLINIAKQGNLKVIFSHRLGETTDSIIADLAAGIGADFVKFGPPVRGERVVKYNRLLEIEQELTVRRF